jgi:hypothetical protein
MSTPYEGARPFPSGKPMEPVLVDEEPRRIVPPPFVNMTTTPRRWPGKDLSPFQQLKALADFDLCRVAIEDVKGQILGMEWDVTVRSEFKDGAEELQGVVDAVKQWIEMPDTINGLDFRAWIGRVLEEVLVTDALCLYPSFAMNGDPIGLEQIDGSTIVPIVDDLGRPVMPPEAAYQQIVHGRPETEFWHPIGEASPMELWYLPRNRRSDTPYGRSPVENVLLTVNLALRHYLHDLAYHTDGNLPDSLFMFPEDKDPDALAEWQRYFDQLLSGRADQRSGSMRMMPPGTYTPTKTREWKYEFMEWLARVVAWAFGVSPMPIAKMMNRATAEMQEISSTESGVRPVADFLATVLNRYISRVLGAMQVEFSWATDETEDETVVFGRNVAYTHGGIRTLNEVRKEIGADPYSPEIGDRAFVLTASGPLYLDTIEEERKRKAENAALLAERLGQGKKPGEEDDDNDEPEEDSGAGGTGDKSTSPVPPALAAHAGRVMQELTKWRRKALKAAKAGKKQPVFKSDVLPPAMRKRIEEGLGVRDS